MIKTHIKIFVLCCVLMVGWRMFSAAGGEENPIVTKLKDHIDQTKSKTLTTFSTTLLDQNYDIMSKVSLAIADGQISADGQEFKKRNELKESIDKIFKEYSVEYSFFYNPTILIDCIKLNWTTDSYALKHSDLVKIYNLSWPKHEEAIILPLPTKFNVSVSRPFFYLASLQQKEEACGLPALANAKALQTIFTNKSQFLGSIYQEAASFKYADLQKACSQGLSVVAKENKLNNVIVIDFNAERGSEGKYQEEDIIKESINNNPLTHFIVKIGQHWVLLTYNKERNLLLYMDSLNTYLRGGKRAERSAILNFIEDLDGIIYEVLLFQEKGLGEQIKKILDYIEVQIQRISNELLYELNETEIMAQRELVINLIKEVFDEIKEVK